MFRLEGSGLIDQTGIDQTGRRAGLLCMVATVGTDRAARSKITV